MTDRDRPLYQRVQQYIDSGYTIFLPDDIREACAVIVALGVASYDGGDLFVDPDARQPRLRLNFPPALREVVA